MARGLQQLRDECANLLLTNFGNEVQHLAKVIITANIYDFVQVGNLSTSEIT